MLRRLMTGGMIAMCAAIGYACAHDHTTGPASGQGMLAVKLTDAPLPFDSVKEVNIFVERIDARRARTDSVMADDDLDGHHMEVPEHPDSALWVTIATPNAAFNLLNLQNGVTAFLGASPVDTGSFRAIRLIIDPARSNIVLLNGKILSDTSHPPVEFDNTRRHGLFVELNDTLDVNEGATTTLVLDIRLGSSLTLRGSSWRDGFFFRPVVVGQREGHEHGGD